MLNKAEKRQLLEKWGDWCRGYAYHFKHKHDKEALYFRGGMHSLAESLKMFKDIDNGILCDIYREEIAKVDAENILEARVFWE